MLLQPRSKHDQKLQPLLATTFLAASLISCDGIDEYLAPIIPETRISLRNIASQNHPQCRIQNAYWYGNQNGTVINRTTLGLPETESSHQLTIHTQDCATTNKMPISVTCLASNRFSPHFYNLGHYHGNDNEGDIIVHFPYFRSTITSYWPAPMHQVISTCVITTSGQKFTHNVSIQY